LTKFLFLELIHFSGHATIVIHQGLVQELRHYVNALLVMGLRKRYLPLTVRFRVQVFKYVSILNMK
jgi:hypothetical protein